MSIRNNFLYNKFKEFYYKNLAYRNIKPYWNLKNLTANIIFKNIKLTFLLEREYDTPAYFKPVYLSSNLGFFSKEINGYFYKNKLPTGGVIIDAGAYQGGFTTYLKKEKPNSKVLAFEPDPKNIKLMKINFKLNNIRNVKIINKGLWNKEENLSFDQTGATGMISKKGKLQIGVTDLDSELRRLKIPYEKVSFVKMDIEGAEIEAIDGMKELLTKGSPQLAIASYHIRNGQKTYVEVEKKLKELGYNVETGYPKHLTTWAWKSKKN